MSAAAPTFAPAFPRAHALARQSLARRRAARLTQLRERQLLRERAQQRGAFFLKRCPATREHLSSFEHDRAVGAAQLPLGLALRLEHRHRRRIRAHQLVEPALAPVHEPRRRRFAQLCTRGATELVHLADEIEEQPRVLKALGRGDGHFSPVEREPHRVERRAQRVDVRLQAALKLPRLRARLDAPLLRLAPPPPQLGRRRRLVAVQRSLRSAELALERARPPPLPRAHASQQHAQRRLTLRA
eukprot:224293-Pleurochrysis_carterae.AAC.2